MSRIYKELLTQKGKQVNFLNGQRTFIQRRYTNGQEAYERMLNIISHQGNANQNHNEIPLITHLDGYYKEKKETK